MPHELSHGPGSQHVFKHETEIRAICFKEPRHSETSQRQCDTYIVARVEAPLVL